MKRKPAKAIWKQDQGEMNILNYVTVLARGMGVGVFPGETIKMKHVGLTVSRVALQLARCQLRAS